MEVKVLKIQLTRRLETETWKREKRALGVRDGENEKCKPGSAAVLFMIEYENVPSVDKKLLFRNMNEWGN